MEDFEFYSPTRFVFGREAEKKTGALVKRCGGTKVLLHFGGGSVKRIGVYDKVFGVPAGDPAAMADEGIVRYRAWIRSLGMPMTLKELGADPKDIPPLVASLGLKGNTIGGFKALTEADVANVLASCR